MPLMKLKCSTHDLVLVSCVFALVLHLDRLSTGQLHRHLGIVTLPPPGISQPRCQNDIQEPCLVERVRGRALKSTLLNRYVCITELRSACQ